MTRFDFCRPWSTVRCDEIEERRDTEDGGITMLRTSVLDPRTRGPSFVLTLALATSGCAQYRAMRGVMNEADCRTADWLALGIEDGNGGSDADGIARYRERCEPHGVVPDPQKYEEGRAMGLKSYCSPRNGFLLGETGASYKGTCPREAERKFLDRYDYGLEAFAIKQLASEAQTRIYTIDRRL